MQTAFKYAITC